MSEKKAKQDAKTFLYWYNGLQSHLYRLARTEKEERSTLFKCCNLNHDLREQVTPILQKKIGVEAFKEL